MPTLTVEVEDALLSEAQKLAEERNTTVHRLVRDYIADLVSQTERRRGAWERFRRMMDENPIEVGERTWTREDLYDR